MYELKLEYSILEHAEIYGHNVWHYLIYFEAIGDIHAVSYEGKGMGLEHRINLADPQAAERYFKKICREMLDGKYL